MRAARRRDDRGAAAVEFALVATVLFTLVFGIIQFGFWLWTWQQSAHAAREASRYAAVYPTCVATIRSRGEEALEGAPVTSSSVDLSGTAPTKVGDSITVTVTAAPIDIGWFSFTPSVTKSATSRVENMPGSGGTCPA